MELGLKGKTALVCASSKGLGFATANSLSKEGAKVFLCSRSSDELEQAAKKITGEVSFLAVDLTESRSRKLLIEKVNQTFGSIDILVNNTGGPAPKSALETPQEAWQTGFEQLFLSASDLSQRVIPSMMEKGFGRIVTITSICVVEPIPNLAVSTAMRSAVTAYAKTLSNEVAARGVTINTVMPGVIHTDRTEFLRQKKAEKTAPPSRLKSKIRRTRSPLDGWVDQRS